jgi:hypothetical protein
MNTKDHNYFYRKYGGSLNLRPPDGDYRAVLVRLSSELPYQLRLFFELESALPSTWALRSDTHYIVSEKFQGIKPDFRNDQRYLRKAALLAKFMQDWTGIVLDMSQRTRMTHEELVAILKRHIGTPAIISIKASLIDFIRPVEAVGSPVERKALIGKSANQSRQTLKSPAEPESKWDFSSDWPDSTPE